MIELHRIMNEEQNLNIAENQQLNITDVSISTGIEIEYSVKTKKYIGIFEKINEHDVNIGDKVLSIKNCNTSKVKRLGTIIDIDVCGRVATDMSGGYWIPQYRHISINDKVICEYNENCRKPAIKYS